MPNRRSAHIALIVLEQEVDTDVVSKCMHLLLTEPGPFWCVNRVGSGVRTRAGGGCVRACVQAREGHL